MMIIWTFADIPPAKPARGMSAGDIFTQKMPDSTHNREYRCDKYNVLICVEFYIIGIYPMVREARRIMKNNEEE